MNGGQRGQGRSVRTPKGQEPGEVTHTEGPESRREVMDTRSDKNVFEKKKT